MGVWVDALKWEICQMKMRSSSRFIEVSSKTIYVRMAMTDLAYLNYYKHI